MERSPKRFLLLTVLVCLCLVSVPTASPWQQPELPVTADTLVRHVRLALGRGALDRARALTTTPDVPTEVRDVATALVEIFEGKNVQARALVSPRSCKGEPGRMPSWNWVCSTCVKAGAPRGVPGC
jgi:hypothetical protein